MKIAIAGYGNLGKCLVKEAEKLGHEVVAVFSRHKKGKGFFPFEAADDFVGEAEVVLAAMGSYDDIEESIAAFRNFHTVDSFDTHARLGDYKAVLNKLKPNKISLCAAGWDPGLLSIVRGVFAPFGEVATLWGPGISQGHSNALRTVIGVIDGVSQTVPLSDAREKLLSGQPVPQNQRHGRVCYVCARQRDQCRIEEQIAAMPNYFCGQQLEIVFCNPKELAKVKAETSHSGEVLMLGRGCEAQACLKVADNAAFTARVMLAFAKAVPQLARDGYKGALDVFDLPLRYWTQTSQI